VNATSDDRVQVTMEAEATEEQEEAVAQVFTNRGISVTVKRDYHRFSLDELPWVLIIQLPLLKFLLQLADRLAKEPRAIVAEFTGLIGDLINLRRSCNGENGHVWLQDRDAGVDTIVGSPPTVVAWENLISRIENGETGHFRYEESDGSWTKIG
jgi:hypothetical protein